MFKKKHDDNYIEKKGYKYDYNYFKQEKLVY